MRLTGAVFGVLLMVGSTGCSDDLEVLDGSGTTGKHQNQIYGGEAPDAPEHDAVVSLHELTPDQTSVYVSPFCSGTLISPDVVVTAAHCLTTVRGKKVIPTKPGSIAVYVGNAPAVDIVEHIYLVSEVRVHPQYDRSGWYNDVALLRLSSQITEPVEPVPHLPASKGLTNADVGGTINFAGFGVIENGTSGVKLQVDGTIGGLGCAVAGCFDSGDAATQFSYTQLESGPCFGDSGGPAFIKREDTAYVAGLTSYGDSDCTIYGVSTRVDAFEGFIADFLDPATPPPPPPTSCNDDGVCGAGESCDGRDGTSACSDCAGLTTGKPTYRYCYVEGACVGAGC